MRSRQYWRMRARTWLLTLAAGLVLADASIVTLALPQLLKALDTTVEGVAAVIAVYTAVLAAALLPAERLARRWGAARAGAAGFALFALASVVCAVAGSLPVLLGGRSLQALGGAAGLVAAFELIGGATVAGRRHWLGAAVLASACGPALGGALTQAFDWRAIFVAQVPLAGVGAWAAWSAGRGPTLLRAGPVTRASEETPSGAPSPTLATTGFAGGAAARSASADSASDAAHSASPSMSAVTGRSTKATALDAAALALVSASLTAVLFGLVLLLIAGWAIAPLAAAATVTVLPLAALAGARIGGPARTRAAGGALLIGGGVLALAWLPSASVAWTFAPQLLAGLGMGLALPAFAGELLPERDAREAARLLTVRHAGIALVLVALAPLIAHRLDVVTERAQQQGIALVLDAKLPPQDKLSLAPALLAGVEAERPRAELRAALAARRGDYAGAERATYDRLAARADATLVHAVSNAFRGAFVLAGAVALLAAALLLVPLRRRTAPALLAAALLALGAPLAYAALHAADAPAPVVLGDPCKPRKLPHTGGISGFLQDRALQALDATACRLHSSREELVLGLATDEGAARFEQRHGVDPRSAGSLLEGLISP